MSTEPRDQLDGLLDAIDNACAASVSERNARCVGDIYAALASAGRRPIDETPERVLGAVMDLIYHLGPNMKSGIETGTDVSQEWLRLLGSPQPRSNATPHSGGGFVSRPIHNLNIT